MGKNVRKTKKFALTKRLLNQDEKVRADQTPFELKRRQAANANEQWWTRESQE